MDFLTENGLFVLGELEKHCKSHLKIMEIDRFELAMLANSFDLYQKAAKYCSDHGVSMPAGDNGYMQICPEYTVMKNEYQNILKHSGKFGLNPCDRAKFFKGLGGKEKKKGFVLDTKMKAA
jgi:phage terminase small subunit